MRNENIYNKDRSPNIISLSQGLLLKERIRSQCEQYAEEFSRFFLVVRNNYSRLSLSRIPRDSLKHFEISVPRNIRAAEVRKTINRTATFNK